MIVFVWMVFGLMAGLLVGKHFHHTAGALALDVTLGVAGALAGGLAVNALGIPEATPYLVAGLFGAAAGSVAMLAGYRAIFRRA